MRDFKGMKRQRGRNRGGGKPQHNANRAFESNGPDNVKVRGAAQTVFERYQQLARDAASAGDRVLAENYLQHAEHYFRTVRAMQPQRAPSEIYGRDQYTSGGDIDFEAEPDEQQQQSSGQGEQPSADNRDNRDNRESGGDGEGQREDRQSRDDRPQQGEGGRGRRDRRDRWRERDDRQPQASGDKPEKPDKPQKSDKPDKPRDDSPVLRSEDGEVSQAPAFLGRGAEAPAGEDSSAPRPRRRRAPRNENAQAEEV